MLWWEIMKIKVMRIVLCYLLDSHPSPLVRKLSKAVHLYDCITHCELSSQLTGRGCIKVKPQYLKIK